MVILKVIKESDSVIKLAVEVTPKLTGTTAVVDHYLGMEETCCAYSQLSCLLLTQLNQCFIIGSIDDLCSYFDYYSWASH
jgi:hypothetical protein